MNCFFCPKCGVRVLHVADLPGGSRRAVVSFKGGVIDEGIDWKGLGTKHIFTESAVMELAGGWECYARYPGEGGSKIGEGEEKKDEEGGVKGEEKKG